MQKKPIATIEPHNKLRYRAKEFLARMTNLQSVKARKRIIEAGIGRTTLSRIINTTLAEEWTPTMHTMEIICEVLNTNLEEIKNP